MTIYIMIGAISVAAVVFSYSISSKMVYEGAVNTNRIQLAQTKKELDEIFASLEKIVVLSGGHERLQKISEYTMPVDEYKLYHLEKTRDELVSYFEALKYVDTAFFYIKNQEKILSRDASPAAKDFYRMIAPDCTYLQWEQYISNDTKNFLMPIKIKNGEEYFLYVAANYYKRAFGNENITFCALIKQDSLTLSQDGMKLFLRKNITGKGVNINCDLNLPYEDITEREGKIRIDDQSYLYGILPSDVWQISYIMLAEESALFEKFHQLQRIHFLIFFVLIVLVGILSYWFARHNSRGWVSVIEAFGEKAPAVRGFDIFQKVQMGITEMVQSYESSLESNREQIQKLKESYLMELCVTSAENIGLRKKELQECGFDFSYPHFSVLIIYPQTEENSSLYAYALKNIAHGILEKTCRLLVGEKGCLIICILNYEGVGTPAVMPPEMSSVLAQLVDVVQESVGDRLGEKVYYTVSDTVDAMERLPWAYNEALSAMDDKLLEEEWEHGAGRKGRVGCCFAGERDKVMINAIRNGDEAAAAQIVHEVFFELKNNKEISGFGIRCFVYDLFCTLIRAAFDMGQEAVNYIKQYGFVQRMEQLGLEREYRNLTLDCVKGLCQLAGKQLSENPKESRGASWNRKLPNIFMKTTGILTWVCKRLRII